jgi:hypothetical protein
MRNRYAYSRIDRSMTIRLQDRQSILARLKSFTTVLFVMISVFIFIFSININRSPEYFIVDANNLSKTDNIRTLSKIKNASQYCFFPAGTVAPYGEILNIFKTKNIMFSNKYDSDNYWFISAFISTENRVYVDVFDNRVIPVASEDIICADNLHLIKTDNGILLKRSGEL